MVVIANAVTLHMIAIATLYDLYIAIATAIGMQLCSQFSQFMSKSEDAVMYVICSWTLNFKTSCCLAIMARASYRVVASQPSQFSYV